MTHAFQYVKCTAKFFFGKKARKMHARGYLCHRKTNNFFSTNTSFTQASGYFNFGLIRLRLGDNYQAFNTP